MLFVVASSDRLLNDIARGDEGTLRALERLGGIPSTGDAAFPAALTHRFDAMTREEWPTRIYNHVNEAHVGLPATAALR
jgi:hypothetical protein